VKVLYVYLITDTGRAPQRAGLRGSSLRLVGVGDLFALVSELDEKRTRKIAEEDLWTHERLAEEAMQYGPVLPMRFGSTVADEAALRSILRDRRTEFRAALERVRGAVEIGLRASLRPRRKRPEGSLAPSGAGAGTAYLLERRAELQGAEATARELQPLSALARESRFREPGPGTGVLTAAYLVEQEGVEEFRRQVDELAAELEDAAIACTGPWPPYSFASTGSTE
jgi:hypothetical protein